MENGKIINKQQILALLNEARELIPFYDAENQRNPKTIYDYGSVDQIALRLKFML